MKLITKAIEKALPPIYSTDGKDVKKIIIKFFTPDAQATWLVFEGDKADNGDIEFFGAVDMGHGHGYEMGYFNLSQLQEVRGKFGLPVERDQHYNGTATIVDGRVIV